MKKIAEFLTIIFSILIVMFSIQSCSSQNEQVNKSEIIRLNKKDNLEYLSINDKGDKLIDFSNVGYMGGGVKIPDVPIVVVLEPDVDTVDDALRIQEAINEVSNMPVNAFGIKGAILLKKGIYNAYSTLKIASSGVILRGEGESKNGTILIDHVKERNNFLTIEGSGSLEEIENTKQEITDEYLASGTRILNIKDASGFYVGDAVCVSRPGTKEWIHHLGMDSIPMNHDKVRQWTPGDYSMKWERKIVEIIGNAVTLDAPIVEPVDKKLSPSYLFKYSFDERILQVGIENIRFKSYFDTSIQKYLTIEFVKEGKHIYYPQENLPKVNSDEQHGWNAIEFSKSENCWVKNVTAVHFGYSCVAIKSNSKYITVQDCKYLDPVSEVRGGTRYSFSNNGQLNLFQRCYAENARHDYVLNAKTRGPNVFFDCVGEGGWNMTEAHHRWAQGGLWDNVNSIGKWAWMQAINRGSQGTGHGWAGTNMVYWNCDSKYFFIQKPPIGQNYAIGRDHYREYQYLFSKELDFEKTMVWVRFFAEVDFPYTEGQTMIGDGYIESPDGIVEPKSLYLQQLKDRLGMDAVKNIATPEQIEKYL